MVVCPIPQRWCTAFLVFIGLTVTYPLRVSINFAITMMVIHKNKSTSESCPAYCNTTYEIRGGSFDWSEREQGYVLSSFAYGLILLQVPAAVLADKVGGKWPMACGSLACAVFHLLIPVGVSWIGYPALIVLRILQGAAFGFAVPGVSALLSRWIPYTECGRMGALMFSGIHIGNFLGTYFTGFLSVQFYYWTVSFYFYGVLTIVWFVLFVYFCYNDFYDNPFISEEEMQYLVEHVGPKRQYRNISVPFQKMLSSVAFWAIVVATVGHDFIFYLVVNHLPTYFSDILRVTVPDNAVLCSMPFFCTWFAALGAGFLCDWVIVRKNVSVTVARKIFTTVALMGPALCFLGVAVAQCNRFAVGMLFCACMLTLGAFYTGAQVNAIDISPYFAATVNSIATSFGSCMGWATPLMVGFIVHSQTITNWRTVFYISSGVLTIMAAFYGIFASSERKHWENM